MSRSLRQRIRRLEAARAGCTACGGRGVLTVVFTRRDGNPSRGDYPLRRCPSCGQSLVVEIVEMTMEEWHGRQNALA